MYVYFDPETLTPGHLILAHDEHYDPMCNGEHHVALPHGVGLSLDHLHLVRDDDGTVAVQIRRASPIVMPPATITFGETVRFTRVPIGTAVAVNDVAQGAMDDAGGVLEVAPASSGRFAFHFTKPGWMDAHFLLEVLPRDLPALAAAVAA